MLLKCVCGLMDTLMARCQSNGKIVGKMWISGNIGFIIEIPDFYHIIQVLKI